MPSMLWRVSSRRKRLLPACFVPPCLATESTKVPSGPGWVHEIKHDGYRMQLRKDGERVRLFTRSGVDWTERYGWPVEAAAALRARSCTIDGELVVAGADGISDFGKLHSRCFDGHAFLYAFDLLELDGEDLRRRPLGERKTLLENALCNKSGDSRQNLNGIRLCEHDAGDGPTLFEAACRMGLEGIVSKRLGSAYRSGRSPSWIKVKNKQAPGFMRVHDGLEG